MNSETTANHRIKTLNPPTLNSQLSILNCHRAFTLVELLVVIAIIGVLATLITAAAVASRQYVKVGVIKTEMHSIVMAIEEYKNIHGEYPPDLSDDAALVRHVKKRWPRFQLPPVPNQADAIRQAINNVYQTPAAQTILKQIQPGDLAAITPSTNFINSSSACSISALPLWLGGFPENADGKFAGFDADPLAPFGKHAGSTPNNGLLTSNDITFSGTREKPVIELIVGKNVIFAPVLSTLVLPVLVQSKGSNDYVPYVYFRGQSDGGAGAYYQGGNIKNISFNDFKYADWGNSTTGLGVAVPYGRSGTYNTTLANSTVAWNDPTTYQLIHPGLDGIFGVAGTDGYRSLNIADPLNEIGQRDMDNIVNFGDGATIKSMLP